MAHAISEAEARLLVADAHKVFSPPTPDNRHAAARWRSGLGWTPDRRIGNIAIVIDETPSVQDLLEAWRDTVRAADLADRLATAAAMAAEQAGLNATQAEEVATMAERAATTAAAAAERARSAADRARVSGTSGRGRAPCRGGGTPRRRAPRGVFCTSRLRCRSRRGEVGRRRVAELRRGREERRARSRPGAEALRGCAQQRHASGDLSC